MNQCQVASDEVHEELHCNQLDSGGVRCEREDFHGNATHWISDHTVQHSMVGNGFSCEDFENKPPVWPMRDILRRQIRVLEKQIAGLGNES